jgi:hypothetical protein
MLRITPKLTCELHNRLFFWSSTMLDLNQAVIQVEISPDHPLQSTTHIDVIEE